MATFVQINEEAALLLLLGGAVVAAFVIAPDASMAVVTGIFEAVGQGIHASIEAVVP